MDASIPECPRCSQMVAPRFSYCPWCGLKLPKSATEACRLEIQLGN